MRMTRRVNSRKSRVGARQIPVGPADLVVLAVGVVVAALGAAHLVAAADHRHADRQQQRRHQVAPLALAQLEHAAVGGRPFDAAVPAQIVVLAVGVAFAVGLVVLVVVADEIGEGEAVVRGDEVDAGVRTPAALLVEIAAARRAAWRAPTARRRRRARSGARCRGTCRSTPSTWWESCRPGSRLRRGPTARRSASPATARDPDE